MILIIATWQYLTIHWKGHRWCLVALSYIAWDTVYPKKYAHGFCFAVLCCGYTLTDFPISIRLTSLALWQSNDCPSASKATLVNMDKYFMWIHYERLLNHNKAKHNKTVCIFLGIYCRIVQFKNKLEINFVTSYALNKCMQKGYTAWFNMKLNIGFQWNLEVQIKANIQQI